MKGAVLHHMDRMARALLPAAITFLLLLLALVPTRMPQFAGVAPLLPLMAIYYWAVYRPSLLPAPAALVFGLLHDVLGGLPLGVAGLTFLLVHGLTVTQRRLLGGKGFLVAWWGFGMIAAGAMALMWLLPSALYGRVVDPLPVFFEYLTTVAVYPLVAWVMARAQSAFLREP